jgi:hypothetical protein
MKHRKLLSLALVLVFALAACGPAQPTSAPVAAAPKPTDAATLPETSSSAGTDFPVGKFIKSGMTDYGLEFKPDGTFSVFSGEDIFVRGTYTAQENVFTETSNDGGCKTNVSFTYTFNGTNLTFQYVGSPNEDATCTGRHADFNNVTYTLSK